MKDSLLLFDGEIENFHRMRCSLFGYHRVPGQMHLFEKDTNVPTGKDRPLGQTVIPTSEGSISEKKDPR